MVNLKNRFQSYNLEVSSAAVNIETNCKIYQLKTVRKQGIEQRDNLYTSQNKRKARPSDAIKNREDILKLEKYFLKTGIQKNRLRNYMVFVMGVSLGLRGSDLLSLNIEDVIDINTGEIVDKISVYERKTGKINYPTLNKKVKTAIANYLEYRFKDTEQINLKEPLTIATSGERMDLNTLYKILTKACNELNLPYHVGTHTLRKTFVYWQLKLHPNNNQILLMVQQMLNHGDATVTLRYAGITNEDKEVLYKDIEKIFEITDNQVTEADDVDLSNFDFD